MSSFQLLAAWTGLLGGTSGVAAVIINVWSLYIDSPRLRINVTHAIWTSDQNEYCCIEIINKGGKEVQLSSLSIEYENGFHSPFSAFFQDDRIGAEFPFRLSSHSAQSWLVKKSAIAQNSQLFEGSNQVKVFVSSLGKKLYSKNAFTLK